MKNTDNTSKTTYRDFVTFMRRYERESKRHIIKENKTNPYKYVSVFKKKDKKENES